MTSFAAIKNLTLAELFSHLDLAIKDVDEKSKAVDKANEEASKIETEAKEQFNAAIDRAHALRTNANDSYSKSVSEAKALQEEFQRRTESLLNKTPGVVISK